MSTRRDINNIFINNVFDILFNWQCLFNENFFIIFMDFIVTILFMFLQDYKNQWIGILKACSFFLIQLSLPWNSSMSSSRAWVSTWSSPLNIVFMYSTQGTRYLCSSGYQWLQNIYVNSKREDIFPFSRPSNQECAFPFK